MGSVDSLVEWALLVPALFMRGDPLNFQNAFALFADYVVNKIVTLN